MKKTNNLLVIFFVILIIAALATTSIMYIEYLIGPVAVYFGAMIITFLVGIAVIFMPKN